MRIMDERATYDIYYLTLKENSQHFRVMMDQGGICLVGNMTDDIWVPDKDGDWTSTKTIVEG